MSTEKDSQAKEISHLVNYSFDGLAHGGRLTLSSGELHFKPNKLERGLKWTGEVTIPYGDILRVDIAPRSFKLPMWDGGIRKRLRITTKDNREYLFVVNGVKKVVAEIQQAVAKNLPAATTAATTAAAGEPAATREST